MTAAEWEMYGDACVSHDQVEADLALTNYQADKAHAPQATTEKVS